MDSGNLDIKKKYEELDLLQKARELLRAKNIEAKEKYPIIAEKISNRSSELKKLQRFMNKLKQNDIKTRDSTLTELETLNLSKFTGEISAIISETIIQQKDLIYYMKLSSNLHQTYEDYHNNLFQNLQKQIKQGGGLTDENAKANRRRNLFRYLCELFLIGFPYPFERIFNLLKEIVIIQDKEIFNLNITTASVFASTYSFEFMGVTSKIKEKDYLENPMLPKINFLSETISSEGKKKIFEFYTSYCEMLRDNLNYSFKKMIEQETKNNTIIIEKGVLDPENESKYKDLKLNYQKTLDNINIIADSLNITINTSLANDEATRLTNTNNQVDMVKEESKDLEKKEEECFTTDEEITLYLELIDLKDYIPEILLFPQKKIEKNQIKTENPEENLAEQQQPQIKILNMSAENMQNNNIELLPTSYEQFLVKLNQCISKDVADDLAKDFCYINSKRNKNKLISDIVEYRYEYALMTPFFCRMIATLGRYFKDIGDSLVLKLLDDFNHLKENTKDSFKDKEKRIRNMKFICELTKFRICSTLKMLNCLKEFLDDFTGQNIEMVILVLETCGQFLLKNKESSFRFNHMLEQINKLRKAKTLTPAIDMQIENALMVVKPSSKSNLKTKKIKSDLEEYVKFLFFDKLSENALDEVADKLLTLPWKNCEDLIVKYFLKVGIQGKFDNMKDLATLLAYIKDKYPFAIIKVTDYLIEQIISGMEYNNFNERQKRNTIIKFFGELYCFEIIDTEILFIILYKLLEYGNDEQNKNGNMIDPPEDTFRITLICTLLESVKIYMTVKKMKRKVDRFLTFFQKYILSKNYLPMLLEFMVLDIFEFLNPNMVFYKNIKDVTEACNKIIQSEEKKDGKQLYEDEIDINAQLKIREKEEEKKRMDEEKLDKLRADQNKVLNDNFDLQFKQMLSESIDESKKSIANPIKINVSAVLKKKVKHQEKNEEEKVQDKKTINLICRQGNKIFAKEISLSNENKIVSILKKKEELEANEKEAVQTITTELHKQSVENTTRDSVYEEYVGNDQIIVKQTKKK